MTEQSLPACLTLSALSGCMGVLATAVLAYPDAQAKKGNEFGKCAQRMAVLLSLLFQLGIAGTSITATWYGPVSLVVPTSSSAQLLFNMLMFGVVLGLEKFMKDMRVGAYVVALAAILLPVVGPGIQEDQDIQALLMKIGSIIWSAILLASMCISGVGLAVSNIRRKRGVEQTSQMFAFNLIVQTTAAVVGTTVSKMFVLVEGAALGVSLAIWIISSLLLVYATVLQATTVSQAKFVPLSVGTKITCNMVTGIIIWEDWRVVTSWIGYVCVFLYLMLGNYLLCEVDVFGTSNAAYGTAATLDKMKSVVFDPIVLLDENVTTAGIGVDDLTSSDEENPPHAAGTRKLAREKETPGTASGVWWNAYNVDRKEAKKEEEGDKDTEELNATQPCHLTSIGKGTVGEEGSNS